MHITLKNIPIRIDKEVGTCYTITVAGACAQAFGTSEVNPESDTPCGRWNRYGFSAVSDPQRRKPFF